MFFAKENPSAAHYAEGFGTVRTNEYDRNDHFHQDECISSSVLIVDGNPPTLKLRAGLYYTTG
jgi:hypothetical protein